jgi:hypothetical protein
MPEKQKLLSLTPVRLRELAQAVIKGETESLSPEKTLARAVMIFFDPDTYAKADVEAKHWGSVQSRYEQGFFSGRRKPKRCDDWKDE